MTQVLTTQDDLMPVVTTLREGGLVLIPTETVYGVGVAVSAFENSKHVPEPTTGYGRIFTLKQRELTQTVPWLVDGPAALDRYATDVPEQVRTLAAKFWPGALTLIVPAASKVPTWMQAQDGTIALRASGSPVVQELIKALDSPLAVTSANTHGMPAPTAFKDIEQRILDGVDIAIDAGATLCKDASTIVAIQDGKPVVLREGAISAQEITSAL